MQHAHDSSVDLTGGGYKGPHSVFFSSSRTGSVNINVRSCDSSVAVIPVLICGCRVNIVVPAVYRATTLARYIVKSSPGARHCVVSNEMDGHESGQFELLNL
jgi:hypothetical protein